MYKINGLKFDDWYIASFGVELEGIYHIPNTDYGLTTNALDRFVKEIRQEFSLSTKVKLENLSFGSDGSIHKLIENSDSDHGLEIRYWDMNSKEGAINMYDFLKNMYSHSAEFNSSCGLHIHFRTHNFYKGNKDDWTILRYENIRKYILQKYKYTYLRDIKHFKFYKDAWVELSNKGPDYAYIRYNKRAKANMINYLGMREHVYEDSILETIEGHDKIRPFKYLHRLSNHYCKPEYRFEKDYTRYNFLNVNNTHEDGDFEFRLMPYADTPEEAMQSINFAVNTISEAVKLFIAGRLGGIAGRYDLGTTDIESEILDDIRINVPEIESEISSPIGVEVSEIDI